MARSIPSTSYTKATSSVRSFSPQFHPPHLSLSTTLLLAQRFVWINFLSLSPLFCAQVDEILKGRFADLEDGTWIVSSKPFCSLNFRMSNRNLTDIGMIMHVTAMEPLKNSVSWTNKPFSYYLHKVHKLNFTLNMRIFSMHLFID